MIYNAELRERARRNLGNSIFHTDWLVGLAICLVSSIIANAIPLLAIFLIGPLSFGICLAYLKKARGAAKIDFNDLFAGFELFADTLVLSLMQGIIVLLWSLIPIVGIYFGIRKGFSYSMAMYVKVDHPEMGWRWCLDESARIMEGHRWQLFCLYLSFIGWAFVGFLACGIGLLWVEPYEQAAVANFYDFYRGQGTRSNSFYHAPYSNPEARW